MREVDFQLVIQKDHELYAMLQLNIPKFVSRYNDILFEKRDYQTKRPPIVSPPGSAWPSSKLAVHWLLLMQNSMVVVLYAAAPA